MELYASPTNTLAFMDSLPQQRPSCRMEPTRTRLHVLLPPGREDKLKVALVDEN
jgi:hypothetical protein